MLGQYISQVMLSEVSFIYIVKSNNLHKTLCA